jgi:haloalkane dehalogenase
MEPPPESFTERAEVTVAPFRELYPFAHHGFETPAGWLHYLDEGAGEAPLLCVHGNPTWSFYFRRVVLEFKPTHRVIAVDHLGCGLSDKPQDWRYDLEGHIDNLEALVLALDLTNITLVLHDWGGAIGMGLAVRQPERIGRILLHNTAAFPSPDLPLRIAASRWPVVGPLLLRGLGAFSRAAITQAVERPLAPAVKRGLLAPYGTWHDRIAQWKFVKDIPMSPAHPTFATLASVDAGLAQLADKPMAIAWGKRDWCFTPKYIPRWLERFPAAQLLEVEDAGHYLLEDDPEATLRFFREFLDTVESEAARVR